jgi:hypothetical protein
MGLNPVDDFLLNLASSLAYNLLKAGAARLRNAAFGDDEQRALRHAWEVAFGMLLRRVGVGLPREEADLLGDVLREFVQADGVGDALLDLALAGREPDMPMLSAQFDALDFDRTTLTVDFYVAMAVLTRGLAEALLDTAGEPGSALYNRVSIVRITATHMLLLEQHESLEALTAKVVRLEQELKVHALAADKLDALLIALRELDTRRIISFNTIRDLQGVTLNIAAGDIIHHGLSAEDLRAILAEFARGPDVLLSGYSVRIENFLAEYLGTPDAPAPFGGRREELDALDTWLSDPDTPYALVAAPAGRGKSALLARWAQAAAMRNLAHVAFVPVSIRFNTALASVTFMALAARLGAIYDDPVKWTDLSPDQWRAVCESYLRRKPPDGRPVLVILDGLDEAVGWRAGPDMFPALPPPGVRAVASARYLTEDADDHGWLRRLGWESAGRARSLPLPALTHTGVSEVLAAMGHPLDALSTRVDVVGELFRLSAGDPLLVRLYIEALLPMGERAAILRPEDLPSIQKGLAGYFNRWWEDQQHQWEEEGRNPVIEQVGVQELLNLCAIARGPLSRDDVAALAEGDLAQGLKRGSVRSKVARLIVGDGQEQGYVFSHPRLSQYFLDQMGGQERRDWEERFVGYGHATLQRLMNRSLAPEEAPAYAVQYYRIHLERAGTHMEELYTLVCGAWSRAWEAQDATFEGFLNDVKRAWHYAEEELRIAVQFQCALGQASVMTMNANIPPALLALAVEHGIRKPGQALAIASRMPDKMHLAETLVLLGPFLGELSEQALAAARSLPESSGEDVDASPVAHALIGLAPYLPVTLRELTTARAIRNEKWQAQALFGLASYLPEMLRAEVFAEALRLARHGDEGYRADTLRHDRRITFLISCATGPIS